MSNMTDAELVERVARKWGIACKSIPYNIQKTAFENCMVTDRPDLALAKAILELEGK